MNTETIQVSEVIFRKDLYPRNAHVPTLVQQYAQDIELLPPIEVNQNNELIDGWHRWTAHRKLERETIEVIRTETYGDMDLLLKAAQRNASHGMQLSLSDKKGLVQRVYAETPESERGNKKKELASMLAITERSVNSYVETMDRKAREQRKQTIYDLWMACYTQQEIADTVGVAQPTVVNEIKNFIKNGKLSKIDKIHADYLEPEFKEPLYNVWSWTKKSEGVAHFGNSDARIVDNLLYAYTKPFDVVVDPFAGGGSTIDVCKKRSRRYFVSDRKPIEERENEIIEHDIVAGILRPPQWDDVKLVYLDPPYWCQARNKYSDAMSDLANMPLERFNQVLSGIIKDYAEKLNDAYIALIISPSQWCVEDKSFTPHLADMIRRVDLPIHMQIQAPYSTEQYQHPQVTWAKENRDFLVLSREIIVWRVEP